jgi:hypothetical protein
MTIGRIARATALDRLLAARARLQAHRSSARPRVFQQVYIDLGRHRSPAGTRCSSEPPARVVHCGSGTSEGRVSSKHNPLLEREVLAFMDLQVPRHRRGANRVSTLSARRAGPHVGLTCQAHSGRPSASRAACGLNPSSATDMVDQRTTAALRAGRPGRLRCRRAVHGSGYPDRLRIDHINTYIEERKR